MPSMSNSYSSRVWYYSKPWFMPLWLILLMLLATLGLTACSEDDPAGPEDENDETSAPTSVISSPARGAFLTAGTMEDMLITVEGEVCDAINPITTFVLNESPLTLTGSGDCRSLMAQLNSSWGLNTLYGLISNDVGNEVALVQNYLRSGEYFAPPRAQAHNSRAAEDVVGIPDAFRARLGQDAIDDGSRADNDDLVSLINLALNAQSAALTAFLNSNMPNPIYSTVETNSYQCLLQTRTNRQGVIFRPNGSVDIRNLRIGEFTITDGQITVEVRTGSISVPIAAAGYVDDGCLGELSASGAGTVGVSGSTVLVTISVQTVGDQVEFAVVDVDVDVASVVIDFELDGLIGWFSNLLSGALSFVGTSLVNAIEPSLRDWFTDVLAPMTERLVGMDAFNVGDLTGPLFGVNVMVETETSLVEVGDGFIDYGVTANAFPTEYVKTSEELAAGTIIGSSTLPAFENMDGSFGLGLKFDFINQVFWAFWAGGGFDFENDEAAALDMLNAALPVPGVTVNSMEMTLPPVLMPGDNDEEVRIGVGGIVLLADIGQSTPSLFAGQPVITLTQPLTIHVSIVFTVGIGLDPESRHLTFDVVDNAEIHVQIESAVRSDQIIELESFFAEATEGLVETLIKDAGTSFALPGLPFDELEIDGIPAGLTWVLDDGVLDQASGYLRIIGSVGVQE